MRLSLVLTLAVCVGLAGCSSQGDSPPRLLVITPDPAASASPIPLSKDVSCRVPPDSGPSRSRFAFTGPCTVTVTSSVPCIHQGDDFYAHINRRLHGGFQLFATVNVEGYKKPGIYEDKTQVYMEVIKGLDIYSWGQRSTTAQVSQDQHRLILQTTRAPAWKGTLAKGTEILGGTLVCRGS